MLAVLVLLAITTATIVTMQAISLNNGRTNTTLLDSAQAIALADSCADTAIASLNPSTLIGTVNGNIFKAHSSNSTSGTDTLFTFGEKEDIAVTGDWNNDKLFSVGMYTASNTWILRNSLTTGTADISFIFLPNLGKASSAVPITGDWDGDGTWTTGFFVSSKLISSFQLRNSNTDGSPDTTFNFGASGDLPITGDWNGDGVTSIGVFRPSTNTFLLRDANTAGGTADITFTYGNSGDIPITGDWDGDGIWTVGVYRPSTSTFYLRNTNSSGLDDITAQVGTIGDKPITGAWAGANSANTITLPYGNCNYILQDTGGTNRTIISTGTVNGTTRKTTITLSQVKPPTIDSWQEGP